MTDTLHEQQARAARNQALFRDVNERIGELQTSWLPLTEIDFLCECADQTCSVPIAASRDEYETVRTSPVRFLVLPEHVVPNVEIVVERNDRFWVVEKIEVASTVARETAPERD